MKQAAVIFYHKNVLKIYEREWIDQCVQSVYDQSFQDFDVLELNYGGGQEQFTKGEFYSVPMENHIDAMNFLISLAFGKGYTIVFNTNLDDHYHESRFDKQVNAIRKGYQLVSSNFHYFGEKSIKMDMVAKGNIGDNLRRGHNVIAHPAVAYHRSFWDADLHYKNLLGYEDLDLWKRAAQKGKQFCILPDYLLNYRIHSNQVTKHYKGK